MTVRHAPWPNGAPAWVSLTVDDIGAATGFYGDLLGWDFDERSTPDGRVYLDALRDGELSAGLGQAPAEMEGPAYWTTFLATDDVDATVRRATEAGASVVVPPDDVDRAGRLAVINDPLGAVVGLWQAREHTGAHVTGVPGAMAWNETLTTDVAAAKAFYATVFGYTYTDMSGPGFAYASFAVGGRTAGGIGTLGEHEAGAGPHWLVYLEVTDVDGALDVVRTHGGTALREPWDSPFGRVAVLAGPAHEVFAIMSRPGGEGGQA